MSIQNAAFIAYALAIVLSQPINAGEPLPQHDAITWRSLDIVNEIVDFGHMADELDLSNEDRQRIVDALNNMVRHAEAVKPELKPDPVPDRDGDDIPDDADDCPDDATDKCNDVPPVPGDHGHFNRLAKDAFFARTFRDEAYTYHGTEYSYGGREQAWGRKCYYDPEQDALVAVIDGTEKHINAYDTVNVSHEPIGAEQGPIIYQWEFRFSESYLQAKSLKDINGEPLRNYKCWRTGGPKITQTPGGEIRGEGRRLELQTRFDLAEEGSVCALGWRNYVRQVETVPEPMVQIKPELWYRVTVEQSYGDAGQMWLKSWIASETEEPRLFYDSKVDGKVFAVPGVQYTGFTVLGNTSQQQPYPEPHEPWKFWTRNLVILTGRPVTDDVLGGKPLSKGE